MKKIGILLLFLLIGIGIVVVPRYWQNSKTILPIPSTSLSQSNSPSQVQNESFIPTHLSIPALQLDTVVEQVGLDKEGRMDVPKEVNDVGWYNLGYKPGMIGSAVIAGHFDTVTGAPAIFYNLSNLKPGDDVIVSDENGKKLSFQVTEKTSYPYDQFPLETVFGKSDKAMLNLITCEGIYNQAAHNYSKRAVVYTELVSNNQ